jgi:hypothetical protein
VEDDLVIALMIEEFVRDFGYAVSSVAGTVAMARLQIALRNCARCSPLRRPICVGPIVESRGNAINERGFMVRPRSSIRVMSALPPIARLLGLDAMSALCQ